MGRVYETGPRSYRSHRVSLNRYLTADGLESPGETCLRLEWSQKLIDVLLDEPAVQSRELSMRIGAGSLIAVPEHMHRDPIGFFGDSSSRAEIAALLGVRTQSELAQTDDVSIYKWVGVSTLVAAVLVPGMFWGTAITTVLHGDEIHQRRVRAARQGRSAFLVALYVSLLDGEITCEEARLIRSLIRHAPKRRDWFRWVLNSLEIQDDQSGWLLKILAKVGPEDEDWPELLQVALLVAHADEHYVGAEKRGITALHNLSGHSFGDFTQLACETETSYRQLLGLHRAFVRGAHAIFDAASVSDAGACILLDVVLTAYIPGERERIETAIEAKKSGLTPVPANEIFDGLSEERSIFDKLRGKESERRQSARELIKSLAVFTSCLEYYVGHANTPARSRLSELAAMYEVKARKVKEYRKEGFERIETLSEGGAPSQGRSDSSESRASPESEPEKSFRVVADGNRFTFETAGAKSVWRSETEDFDLFCESTLGLDESDRNVLVDCDPEIFSILEEAVVTSHSVRTLLKS